MNERLRELRQEIFRLLIQTVFLKKSYLKLKDLLLYFFQSILGIFISALTGSEDPEEVALMAKQGTEVK